MSVANKLFDRSHGFVGDINATNPDDLPALFIDGSLGTTPANIAYTGKLNIHNAVGACKASLFAGSLPPGYTVVADNKNKQVVIKWPAYKTGTVDIPNSNFVRGDDGSWELGPGFTIESTGTVPDPNDPGNTYQLQFANLHADPDGPDTMSTLYFPLADARSNGQTSITASADIQQGASSENQAGAAVRVLFYDNVGLQVGGMDGNVIKSGSNSNWQTSTVNAPIPALASYARVGASAYRKGQNRALWIDNIKWNLTQASQGTNQDGTFTITILVIDSIGREAYWTGSVVVSGSVTILAQPSFLTNLTDDYTGLVWTQLNATDSISGDTFPKLSTVSPSGSGINSMQTNVGGSLLSLGNAGIGSSIPAASIGTNKPFCIEMFAMLDPSAEGKSDENYYVTCGIFDSWRFTFEPGVVGVGRKFYVFGITVTTETDRTMPYGMWRHLAFSFDGAVGRSWINGKLVGQINRNYNPTQPIPLFIGRNGDGFNGVTFPGWVTGVRLSAGWARYTAPFTPPTLPY